MTANVSIPVIQAVIRVQINGNRRRVSYGQMWSFFQKRFAVVRPLRAPSDAAIFTAEQEMCCTRRGVRRRRCCYPLVTVILLLHSTAPSLIGSHNHRFQQARGPNEMCDPRVPDKNPDTAVYQPECEWEGKIVQNCL